MAEAHAMPLCLGCTPVTLLRDCPERLGVSRRKVASMLAEGVLERLDRYLVVGACVGERARADRRLAHRLKLDRLLLTYPECAGSHASAAVVLRLPTFGLPSFATATRSWGAWRGGPDGRIRIAPLPADHLALADGVLTTGVARTVVDVARGTEMRGAVVIGDAALARGLDLATLLRVLDECAAWSDVGRARKVISFLDARAESPLESISRVVMHEYRLPPPEPQYWIDVEGGRFRADFYWKQQRLIGEADGRAKYSIDPAVPPEEAAWREKLREDALRDAGYRVVRWTYDQMVRQTDATIARIRRRLAS